MTMVSEISSVTDLPDGAQDVLEFAEAIRSRKLQAPVLLALEMHRPLAGIGNFCFSLLRPFLGLVVASHKVEVLSRLLEQPELLDYLIMLLEDNSNGHRKMSHE